MKPCVSVLMSAYNAEQFISDAINSILNQSYGDFEFLIIDDGSEDSTKEIIESFNKQDERIRSFYNMSNKGLIYSLNKGLDAAKGKYIARMDADDVSLPTRLETQVAFMDANADVGVSSAWMKTLGKVNDTIWKSPLSHEKIMAKMFCYNCVWHPVSIIRKDVLTKYNLQYDSRYPKAEDYKLWLDIAEHSKLANLPQVLHRYRIHETQKTRLSAKSRKKKEKNLKRRKELPGIRVELLMKFLSREITLEEIELHAKLFFEIPFTGENELANLREWIKFLVSVNAEKKIYVEPEFSNYLWDTYSKTKAKSFMHYCKSKKRYSPEILKKLFLSNSKYYSDFSMHELMMLSINSLIFRKNKEYSGTLANSKRDSGFQ